MDKDTPVIRKNLDDLVAFFFSRAKSGLNSHPGITAGRREMVTELVQW